MTDGPRSAKNPWRPGLGTVAAIGALTWAVALWVAPRVMPAPVPAAGEILDHEAALDPLRTVLALTVPDGTLEARPAPRVRTARVSRGDTMMEVLVRAHVQRDEAHAAIAALRDVYNPRDLMPGTELALTFQPLTRERNARESFRGFSFRAGIDRTIRVSRSWDNSFESSLSKIPLTHEQSRAAGRIDNSIYVDSVGAGVPVPIVVEMIRAMSFDVDFQRDIQPGDRFDVLYDRLRDPGGKIVGSGDVIFAALTLSGKRLPIYRFRMDDGTFDYFNEKGESTRKALMRTPIDGARLSSRFGRRRHPILGYNRMHRGIDFAAPRGTPIMAAGRGAVVEAGWKGGYGRYVRIRHNTTYATAYAHMSRFARGIRRGTRVSQGQVIGYVGSSGRSTGPHLHYEVLRNNRQVNPLSVKLPTGKTLHGAERKRFLTAKAEVDRALRALDVAETRPSPADRTD